MKKLGLSCVAAGESGECLWRGLGAGEAEDEEWVTKENVSGMP